jgi:hypothetical protein
MFWAPLRAEWDGWMEGEMSTHDSVGNWVEDEDLPYDGQDKE